MKFSSIFVITLFIPPHLHAMKLTNPTKYPSHVAVTEKGFVIAGHNGVAFFDKTKNECTHHYQQNKKIEDLAVSKTKIATSTEGLLTVYDMTTQEKAWEYNTDNKFAPITFDSQDDDQLITMLSRNRIVLLKGPTVHDNDIKKYKIPNLHQQSSTLISCHPHTTSIIYSGLTLSSYGKLGHRIYSIKMLHIHLTQPQNEILSQNTLGTSLSWVMSTDARYELTKIHQTKNPSYKDGWSLEFNRLSLRDTHTPKTEKFLPSMPPYTNAIFHPNNIVLITLSRPTINEGLSYQIDCWKCDDILKTKSPKPIATYTLDDYDHIHAMPTSSLEKGKSLAISPDGSSLVVATHHHCFLYNIPFETIAQNVCELGTKERCITTLLTFNNYEDELIPSDITTLIMHYLLQLQLYKCLDDQN